MYEIWVLLIVLAVGCILSGPIALIISITALNRSKARYRVPPERVERVVPERVERVVKAEEAARPPRYDLKQRLNYPLQVKARVAKLGSITNNPLFGQAEEKPVAWTEKHKVLLLIIMVATVLVLGGFILKSFKSIRSDAV